MPELAGEGRGAWPLVTEEMFWERREREGSNFASTYLNHLDENVLDLSSQCKYALLKTHYAPQIVHQNLAVFLWQLYSSKISFMGSGGCSQ